MFSIFENFAEKPVRFAKNNKFVPDLNQMPLNPESQNRKLENGRNL